jgi:hypothetical protein
MSTTEKLWWVKLNSENRLKKGMKFSRKGKKRAKFDGRGSGGVRCKFAYLLDAQGLGEVSAPLEAEPPG